MIVRCFVLALCVLLFGARSHAQGQMTLLGVRGPSAATYTGPLDIVSGATAAYTLRCASAADAASPTNKVNLREGSGNTTANFKCLSNGNFDVAGVKAFAPVDGTASCTIASTTITCTGASATPHVNDTVTGSGIGGGCYLTAVGAFTAGSGTATVSSAADCGTISVAVAVTFTWAVYVTKWYDSSGNICDVSQAISGNQPLFVIGLGAFSGNLGNSMVFNGTSTSLTATCTRTLPVSVNAWINSTTNSTRAIISTDGGVNGKWRMTTSTSARFTLGLVTDYDSTLTFSTSTWYMSSISVTGSPGSVSFYLRPAGGSLANNTVSIGSMSGTVQPFTIGRDFAPEIWSGAIGEVIVWPNTVTSGNFTSIYDIH